MDERARRIGENEILFRTVNEKLEDVNAAFGELSRTLSIVCECGDARCTEQITVSPEEYERVRGDPETFVVASGHDAPDVEDVVATTDRYDVVRKKEVEPAELARRHDPRD